MWVWSLVKIYFTDWYQNSRGGEGGDKFNTNGLIFKLIPFTLFKWSKSKIKVETQFKQG